MPIVNLTPHPIDVSYNLESTETAMTIYPTRAPARISMSEPEVVDEVDDVTIYYQAFGDVVDLPEPTPGTVYIVSLPVAMKAQRPDVLAAGPAIRDDSGFMVGNHGFLRVTPEG